ncbi:hypothetical protein THAOC_18564 [Thalassiosira oceanica]|uniref:Uncharacterized protein n=1 Tax=Thalassiosira oceanica TaxID=159749 RepID=K0S7V7_THAOC|nr:hypothetical protein THAOC_18564 [Thalassiosira oceanica]|eukprot:EJK61009.1 hypothetical protein THAOC_18564 [Thalassiosira oceanica]
MRPATQLRLDPVAVRRYDSPPSEALLVMSRFGAVLSLDGDIPQLKAVKEELEALADNGVTLNKGNPSRTIVEQACDLAVLFKLLHQKLPARTMKHILAEDSPFKKMLFDAFDFGELADILNLSYTKRETIVDFIVCYLEIMTEIASTHNVQAGFIDNGTLDPVNMRIPTLDGILATCKRNISLEEKQNIIDNFDEIFDSFEKHGCMPESVHDAVGIADDLDPHGQVVRREADANREHLQRCKCMNHPQVINERNELQRKSNSKQLESMEKVNAKFLEKVQSYNNSIQKTRALFRDEGLGSENECDRDETFIEECTLEHFGKLTVDSLKAFIFGRNPISGKAPNKGTVDGAKNGDRNLILLAYECKAMPNKHALLSKRPYSNDDLQKYRANPINVTTITLGDDTGLLPSQVLGNNQWRHLALRLIFHGGRVNFHALPTQDEKDLADSLIPHLRHRFEQFKLERIPTQQKRRHWTMEHLDLCGVYLQEDIVRGSVLRTGYAMGNINEPRGSFGTRIDQHLKSAMADKPKADSNIYRLFPSRSSKRAESMGRKGLWETHIRTRMAIGFDRNSEPAKLLDKGYDEGGIMVMNTTMKARIKSSMKHMSSDIQRFQSMFALSDVFALCHGIAGHSFGRWPRLAVGCPVWGRTSGGRTPDVDSGSVLTVHLTPSALSRSKLSSTLASASARRKTPGAERLFCGEVPSGLDRHRQCSGIPAGTAAATPQPPKGPRSPVSLLASLIEQIVTDERTPTAKDSVQEVLADGIVSANDQLATSGRSCITWETGTSRHGAARALRWQMIVGQMTIRLRVVRVASTTKRRQRSVDNEALLPHSPHLEGKGLFVPGHSMPGQLSCPSPV